MTYLAESLEPMGNKNVVVVIGRFNPPQVGHYKLINAAKKFIREKSKLRLEAMPIVAVIGGNKSDLNKKLNPLSTKDRIRFMEASGNAAGVKFIEAPNAFAALAKIREMGYEPIVVATGSDRANSYISILDKYFKTPHGDDIKHYSITLNRDDSSGDIKQLDSTLSSLKDGDLDIETASASLARRAAQLGYEEEFAKIVGLQDKPQLAKRLMLKIAASMRDN